LPYCQSFLFTNKRSSDSENRISVAIRDESSSGESEKNLEITNAFLLGSTDYK